jgi:hypothetical protein
LGDSLLRRAAWGRSERCSVFSEIPPIPKKFATASQELLNTETGFSVNSSLEDIFGFSDSWRSKTSWNPNKSAASTTPPVSTDATGSASITTSFAKPSAASDFFPRRGTRFAFVPSPVADSFAFLGVTPFVSTTSWDSPIGIFSATG